MLGYRYSTKLISKCVHGNLFNLIPGIFISFSDNQKLCCVPSFYAYGEIPRNDHPYQMVRCQRHHDAPRDVAIHLAKPLASSSIVTSRRVCVNWPFYYIHYPYMLTSRTLQHVPVAVATRKCCSVLICMSMMSWADVLYELYEFLILVLVCRK